MSKTDVKVTVGSSLIAYALIVALIALWTQRNLSFWVSQAKHNEQHVSYFLSYICTFFSGGLALPANVVSEIVRLFV